MFGHKRFKAYQLSIEFLAATMNLLDQCSNGNGHIRDQPKRAATSIPLNLAEGSGKMSNKDKLRFHAIARGPALEYAEDYNGLVLTEPRLKNSVKAAKETPQQIARILTTLCSKIRLGWDEV